MRWQIIIDLSIVDRDNLAMSINFNVERISAKKSCSQTVFSWTHCFLYKIISKKTSFIANKLKGVITSVSELIFKHAHYITKLISSFAWNLYHSLYSRHVEKNIKKANRYLHCLKIRFNARITVNFCCFTYNPIVSIFLYRQWSGRFMSYIKCAEPTRISSEWQLFANTKKS